MTVTLLLDSSVWLAAFDKRDPEHESARSVMLDGRFDHSALDLTLYEVANVAVRKWRALSEAHRIRQAILLAARETLVRADAELLESAAEFADVHGLSVYDAAYVAAHREREADGWRLVSLDTDLTEPKFAETPAELLGSGPRAKS